MKTFLSLVVCLLIINIHLSATLSVTDQATDYILRVTDYTIPTTAGNFVAWIDHVTNGDTPTEGTDVFARNLI